MNTYIWSEVKHPPHPHDGHCQRPAPPPHDGQAGSQRPAPPHDGMVGGCPPAPPRVVGFGLGFGGSESIIIVRYLDIWSVREIWPAPAGNETIAIRPYHGGGRWPPDHTIGGGGASLQTIPWGGALASRPYHGGGRWPLASNRVYIYIYIYEYEARGQRPPPMVWSGGHRPPPHGMVWRPAPPPMVWSGGQQPPPWYGLIAIVSLPAGAGQISSTGQMSKYLTIIMLSEPHNHQNPNQNQPRGGGGGTASDHIIMGGGRWPPA